MIGLTSFFGTIMKGLGASSRIFELLDARPLAVKLGVGRVLPVTTPPRRLVFDNVHFAYPSRPNTEILKGVNLSIEPGKIVSIAGGSGSGKSTLANLLIRYYDPQNGRVMYGEDDIRSFTPESWRKQIAVVPQDPALFSTTIAENSEHCSACYTSSAARANELAFIQSLTDDPMLRDMRSKRLRSWQTAVSLIHFPVVLILKLELEVLSYLVSRSTISKSLSDIEC